MSHSPWGKSTRKPNPTRSCHPEESQTDPQGSSCQGKTESKWTYDDTVGRDNNDTAFLRGIKLGQRLNTQQDKLSSNQQTSRTDRSGFRGNASQRIQSSDKVDREASKDIQRVQRILQIDNDILKSKIKNLDSQYKARKDHLEAQNYKLVGRTQTLQALVSQERSELVKLKGQFLKMMVFVQDKFASQEKEIQANKKEILALRGTLKALDLNNKAQALIDSSNVRRSPSPRLTSEDPRKQKLVERVKLLEFQLKNKTKEVEQLKNRSAHNWDGTRTSEHCHEPQEIFTNKGEGVVNPGNRPIQPKIMTNHILDRNCVRNQKRTQIAKEDGAGTMKEGTRVSSDSVSTSPNPVGVMEFSFMGIMAQ